MEEKGYDYENIPLWKPFERESVLIPHDNKDDDVRPFNPVISQWTTTMESVDTTEGNEESDVG